MKKRIISTLFISILTASMIVGCGSSYEASYNEPSAKLASEEYIASADDYATEEYIATDDYNSSEDSNDITGQENLVDSNRKLIRTVNISVETTEYDSLVKNVRTQVTELGGYIENTNESVYSYTDPVRHYSSFTIRIPKQKADSFINTVQEKSNVTNKSENIEDVTLSYVDTESRKKSLEAEQDRLLELMKQAESIEDLIAIEDRLSQVRYELESQESRLRSYDNQIDYTTIYLNIDEVERIVPKSEPGIFSRITNGFSESMYNTIDGLIEFFIWFIVHIPYLVIWAAVICFIIFVIIKPIRKHSAKKKEEKLAKLLEKKEEMMKNSVE